MLRTQAMRLVAALLLVAGFTYRVGDAAQGADQKVELGPLKEICDHAFDGYVIHMRYRDKPKGTATSKLDPHIEEYDRLYQFKVRVTKVHHHRPNPFVHENSIIGYSVGRKPTTLTPEQEAEDHQRRRKGMPPKHMKITSKAVSSSLSSSTSEYSYGHEIKDGDVVNVAIWRVIHVDDRGDFEDEHLRGPLDISKHQSFSVFPTIADIVEDDDDEGGDLSTKNITLFRFYTQGLHHRFETYEDTLEHFSKTAAQSPSISVKALLGGDGDVEVGSGDEDEDEDLGTRRHNKIRQKRAATKSQYSKELGFGSLSAAILPAAATVEPHIPHGIERLLPDGTADKEPQDKFTKIFSERFNFGSMGGAPMQPPKYEPKASKRKAKRKAPSAPRNPLQRDV